MLIFRYDKSFEGLLTSVFDAYNRRTFPDLLLDGGEPGPLFVDGCYEVLTQADKADRVWQGLRKRLPKEVCSMLMYVWFSEEPGSDMLLMRYIRKVFDSPDPKYYENFADGDVLLAHKIARRVSKERSYIVQFLRFQKASDGTFFAPVSPPCNALPLAVEHFRTRYSDQKWLIYDLKRKYGYYYDLQTVVEITLEGLEKVPGIRLDDEQMAGDERLFQELWKGYFKSMTIRERINPKLHRQHLPRRFWKYLPEKQ